MKRFKKLLIALSGLALSVGAAFGVGLNADKKAGADVAIATDGDSWYYRGTDTQKNANGWNNADSMSGYGTLSEGGNYVVWHFNSGEQFKFTKATNNWNNQMGGSNKTGSAVTSGHMTTVDGNVNCTSTGYYKIKVSSSNIYIDDINYLSDITGTGAKVYRFTNNDSWSNVYVHAWNTSDSSHNTAWPGIKLEDYYFNDQHPGEAVNIFPTNYTYTNFIFHNNSNARIETGSIGSTKAWYVGAATDQYDGSERKYTPGTWSPANNTYRFYDYDNSHENLVRCYAFSSNTGLENSEYNNATLMTRVTKGGKNTRVYEISVDSMFDKVIFKTAGSGDAPKLTGDVWFNEHSDDVYSSKTFDDSTFFEKHGISYEKALADDWLFNFMHFRDIEHNPLDEDSGNCKSTGEGGLNYYADAVASYNGMDNSVKAIIASYGAYYTNAQARLSAWASACGQTAVINESAGTYTLATGTKVNKFVPTNGSIDSGNDATLIIVIASCAISLLAVGGYFFIRRKADR